MTPNQKAFLDMIAFSEGTSAVEGSDDGYDVIVGGSLFPRAPDGGPDYSKHPKQVVHLRDNLNSTAAGRYQLLARYYDAYSVSIPVPDFSPDSQDAIAMQQIKECDALDDIEAGFFNIAVAHCSRIWASLPGNSYGQRQNGMDDLKAKFVEYGGTVAEQA